MPIPERFVSGDELTAEIVDALLRDRSRWRRARGDETVEIKNLEGNQPPIFSARGGSTTTTSYIQITDAANATFGGYPWQGVVWQPALYLISGGLGYSGTVTVSFTTAGSGNVAPTATIDVTASGTLATPNIVTTGSKMTSCSASPSGGGGSGGSLGCLLDGGKLTGGGWITNGLSGTVGAVDSRGNPTPGDLAYEVRGSLAVPVSGSGGTPWPQGSVYPAWRSSQGRLLFFSSGIVPAQTVTISSYPTSAFVFYGCKALLFTGLDGSGAVPAEGATPGYSTSSWTFLAANLGSAIPSVGTNVKCEMVPTVKGPIFVFRYD